MSIDGTQVSIQSQRTVFSGQIEMSQLILTPSPDRVSIDVYECCIRQQRIMDRQQCMIDQLVTEIKDLKERMIRCEYAPGGPGYVDASVDFHRTSHGLGDGSHGLDDGSHGLNDGSHGLGDGSHGLDDGSHGLDDGSHGLDDGRGGELPPSPPPPPVLLGLVCDQCHATDVPCESIPTSEHPEQLLCATCQEHEKNLGSLSKQNEEEQEP